MSNGYEKFWETVERNRDVKRPESQQQDIKTPGSDIFWKTVGLDSPSTQAYPQQSGIEYIDSKLKQYGLYDKTSRPGYAMDHDVAMEQYGYAPGITAKDVGYSPSMKASYDSFLSGREKSKPMPKAVKSQIGDLQKQIDALTEKISFAQENYDTVGAKSLLEQQRKLQTELYQLQADNAESEYDRYMAQYKLHNQSFLKLLDGDGSSASAEDYRNFLKNDKTAVAAKDNAEMIDYIAKYADKERKDNFGGQFAANYDLGTISQDSAIAWDEYLSDPTEENRRKAEALSVAAQEYQNKNAAALDDENAVLPWVTKSLANYLPQFIDQQAMQIPLGIITAVATLNPANYKYGATVGSGVYSYRTMRGAAYRSLLDAGVPEERARAAAKDEAVISSLIEMGETFLSLSAFGINKLSGGAVGNAGAKIAGALESKLPSSAARALLKVGKALAAYGINIFSESQEERSQEAVSIANENRDYTQDTGIGDLAYAALKKYIGGFTGSGATEEEIARMKESEAEGAKLAAMLGGVETAQAAILNGKLNSSAKRYTSDVNRMIEDGMESPEGTKSRKYAEEARKKVDSGKTLSGYQIRELAEANAESILSQDVGKITKAVEKQLTDRGYEGSNTEKLAAAIAKTVAGQDTTRAERNAIRNSEQAKQILQEIAGASDVVQKYAESGAAYQVAEQKAELAGEQMEQAQNDVSMDTDFKTAAENFRAADEKRTAAKEAFDAAQNEYENGSTAWARKIGARVVGDGVLSENSVEGYSHLFGKHAKLFTEAHEDGQDARQYTIEFAKAYNEGTKGGNLQALIDSGSLASLSTVQINAAYQAGLDARNSLNTRRDTDGLHLRQSSIWENGANSTADVQEVEANAEQNQKRNADSGRKTAAEKAAGFTAEKAYRRVTTLEELGVKDAKAGIKVTQVSSDYSDETAKAYEMCVQNGVQCVFFTGGYLQTKDGIIARGANKGGVVYIRADDPNFTANEIAGHEIGHELVNRGSLDMDAVISEVRKEYTNEELSKIVDDYGLDFLASGVNEDELTDLVIEEITCDALGGMNAFASNREGNAEFVQKLQGLAEKHYTGKTGEGTFARQRDAEQKLSAVSESAESRISDSTRKDLEKSGLTVQDGVVVADNLAKQMREEGYEKPVDVFDIGEKFSVVTEPEWRKSFLKNGGSADVAELMYDADMEAFYSFRPTDNTKENEQQMGTEHKLSSGSKDLTDADKRELAVGDVISMKQQKNLFADRQTGEIVKYSVVNDGTEIEPLRNPDGSIKYVYKAFYAMDGKLYPPMVANLTDQEKKSVRGAASGTMRSIDTPVGVWLRADVGTLGRYRNDATEYDVMFRKLWSGTSKPVVELKKRFKQLGIDGSKNRELAMRELEKVVPKLAQASKTKIVEKKGDLVRNSAGRLAVENAKGGDTLAFRPGWHLGEWPDAKQFNKDSKLGKKFVMPDGLVFAKCMIAGAVDYQLDAMSYGVKENGKYDRTQAGLPTVPENGYYKYRTNPDPKTAPWYITGAMKVVEILDDDDCARICAEYGVTADPRESFQKIDLAKYGLKRGPVTAPSDLKPYEKSQQSYKNDADLQAALSDPAYAGAYVKRSIDFDDPEILKEFERNGQSAEEYRKKANGDQNFSTVNSTQLALENPDVYDEIQVTFDEILQKTKGRDLETALLEEVQKHQEDRQMWEHEAAVLTKLWKQSEKNEAKLSKALSERRDRIAEVSEELRERRRDVRTMENEFIRVVREWEKQTGKLEGKTKEAASLKQALKDSIREHRKDNAAWEREYDRLLKMYERNDRQIDRLEADIAHRKEMAAKGVEGRKRTVILNKILDLNKDFQKILDRPEKGITAHAPRELIKPIAEFCGMFASAEYGYRTNQLNQAIESGNSQTRIDQIARAKSLLADISNRYAKLSKESGLAGASYTQETAEQIARATELISDMFDSRNIHEMNSDELTVVYNAMKSIMHSIKTANRLTAMETTRTLAETVDRFKKNIDEATPASRMSARYAQRYLMWQMSPHEFFQYICGYAKDNVGLDIDRMFKRGTEKMLGVQRDFDNLFNPILNQDDKEIRRMTSTKEKDLVTVGLKDRNGNEVKLTRGMRLSVYMMLSQEDGLRSIAYGGFALPRIEEYYHGNISAAYGGEDIERLYTASQGGTIYEAAKTLQSLKEELKEARDDAQRESLRQSVSAAQDRLDSLVAGEEARLIRMREDIWDSFSDYEKQLVNAANQWMEHSGNLMQETYYELNGFDPVRVNHYWPIHRDPTTIQSLDTTAVANEINLANSGFTKARVKANNPILLTDFFQELMSSKQKMSRYYGFAVVQRDFNKLYMFTAPGSDFSVKKRIMAKFQSGTYKIGVSAEQYIDNYLKSVSGANKADSSWLSDLYSRSAGATLTANARVALSQLASIPTAAAVVGWKNAAIGFSKGLGYALSKQAKDQLAGDSVWFYQRYKGEGSTREIADMRNSGGLAAKAMNSGFARKYLNWCQNMDVLATGPIMWEMAKSSVLETGMKETDPGFKAAVQDNYADIIRFSQPNYTETERSDLLRDKRVGSKILTMYKTQSNQNLNILVGASLELRKMKSDFKAGKNGVTASDVKAATAKCVSAYTAVAIGNTVLFPIMRFIGNLVMRNMKPYKDDETGEVDLESVMDGILKDAFSSMAGTVAMGSILYDGVYAVLSGERYYGISDNAVGLLSDTLTSMVTLGQSITSGKNVTDKAVKMLLNLASSFGIPAKNLKNLATAAYGWANQLLTGGPNVFDATDTTSKQDNARFVSAVLADNEEKAGNELSYLISKSDEPNLYLQSKDAASNVKEYLKDQFEERRISEDEATKVLRYLEYEDEDIEASIKQWKCVVETGIKHGNIGKSVMKGIITEDYAVKLYMTYGGLSESEARDKVYVHVFNQTYPKLSDLSEAQKLKFRDIEKSGISAEQFAAAVSAISKMAADKDKNGNTISGSKKGKVVRYIQNLSGLSSRQKKILWDSVKGDWTDKDTPWG